jgi:prepilin-type N-terminal cleavage/methylation domain-containing protein
MNRAAFTLLELLIVIAIIAGLAALLLSVLARTRQHSLSVPCTSNLHQLQLAWKIYVEDYEGEYPSMIGQIFPYVRNKQVFVCPLDHFGGASPHATRRLSSPVSYFYLLSDDVNSPRHIEILRRYDANHTVFYCVLHGTPCGASGLGFAKNSYEGKVLGVKVDGSVRTKQVGFRCFRLPDGTYLVNRPPWDFASDVPCPQEQLRMFCGVPDEYTQEIECPCGQVRR